MFFDPIRATLVATDEELALLAGLDGLSATGTGDGEPGDGEPGADDHRAAVPGSSGVLTDDGRLHPTVAGIVGLVAAPARSVVIERFDRGLVAPLFVAFDRRGRAVVTEGAGDAGLSMTATHLELLPALLSQALRLHAGLPCATRRPLDATAGQVEAALTGADAAMTGAEGAAPAPGAEPGLAAVLGAMTHGWRASASWAGAEIDRSVTVMSAGDEGLWHVDRGAADHGPVPIGPDDRLVLRPVTVAEARALLGDVVTGRRRA